MSTAAFSSRPAAPVTRDETLAFLQWLMAADLMLIVLDQIHLYTPLLPAIEFSLHRNGGYAEAYMYLKEFWIALALALAWPRLRESVVLAWSGLFAFMVLDDSLRLHERAGRRLAEAWNFPHALGLEPKDLGELAIWSAVGLVLFGGVLLGYLRASRAGRALTHDLLTLFAGLLVFGVGADMLHSAFSASAAEPVLGLVEDGGEMLVMSAIACYVFQWARSPHEAAFRPAGLLALRWRRPALG